MSEVYVPKVGERVRIVEARQDGDEDGRFWQTGLVVTAKAVVPYVHGENAAAYLEGCVCIHAEEQKRFGAWVRCVPADQPSDEAKASDESRAPDPLPEVLPAGTRWGKHRLTRINITRINISMTDEAHARYTAAAERHGLTLSAWLRLAADRQAERKTLG